MYSVFQVKPPFSLTQAKKKISDVVTRTDEDINRFRLLVITYHFTSLFTTIF